LNLEQNYKTNIPFKLVLNKFDTRTSLSHEVLSTLIKHPIYGEKLFKTYVRASQEFPNAIANSESIYDTLKNSSAKEDIDLLTVELLEIQKKNSSEISLGTLGEAA
jgi:chromosome partitioning protein